MASTNPSSESSAFRKRLIAAFNAEELISFCFDHFHSVYEDFTPGMTKLQMVRHLLDYCIRREYVPTLLDFLEDERPGIVKNREVLIDALIPTPTIVGDKARVSADSTPPILWPPSRLSRARKQAASSSQRDRLLQLLESLDAELDLGRDADMTRVDSLLLGCRKLDSGCFVQVLKDIIADKNLPEQIRATALSRS
jgi:hypothetical protein